MRKCSLDKMNLVFAEIAKNAALYLPVDQNDGSAAYKKWEEGTVWSNALNTVRSPKDFFFPQTEDLMKFTTSGKNIEVMVYGDGAFKDPVGKIWELADPVVSPGFTSGLQGQPNELKLKYLADNDFADLRGDELKAAISAAIKEKDDNLVGQMATEGTTPRRLTDLLGSLCDLTSGSGDKGTPFIYIQGYFDNYTD